MVCRKIAECSVVVVDVGGSSIMSFGLGNIYCTETCRRKCRGNHRAIKLSPFFTKGTYLGKGERRTCRLGVAKQQVAPVGIRRFVRISSTSTFLSVGRAFSEGVDHVEKVRFATPLTCKTSFSSTPIIAIVGYSNLLFGCATVQYKHLYYIPFIHYS